MRFFTKKLELSLFNAIVLFAFFFVITQNLAFWRAVFELLSFESDEYETSMLYISDHGESLGEKGLYLHGTPYAIAPKEQTTVPLIFWGSDEFYKARNFELSCVQQRARTMNYSHDNIFHTLIGLLYVRTKEYQPELNIFGEC